MKHLISIDDLTAPEIEGIFSLAAQIKKNPEAYREKLQGKVFGLIFEKPSTRTLVSFEVGIQSMGGGTIFMGPGDFQLGVREEVKDVARVLGRYLDGVVLRTFSHGTITTFERYFHRPVINGLSDFEHPCQALADFLTIKEHFTAEDTPALAGVSEAVPARGYMSRAGGRAKRGPLKGSQKPLLAFVGDGNNVLNSLILLTAKLGGRIRYATPARFQPDSGIVKKARELAGKSGASLEALGDPREAVKGADFVYTDVWISMGEEKKRKTKMKSFKGFQVNSELLGRASKSVKVLHCLPAHRGEEITEEVLEGKSSVVFDQAENRLHVQKAVLIQLCGQNSSKESQ